MAPTELPYRDISEVRNLGRRRANLLLARGWILLDWEVEQTIGRRDVPDEKGEPQPMWFKLQSIQYILGRPSDVSFTSDDLYEFETRQAQEQREAREAAEQREAQRVPDASPDTEANLVIKVEEAARSGAERGARSASVVAGVFDGTDTL